MRIIDQWRADEHLARVRQSRRETEDAAERRTRASFSSPGLQYNAYLNDWVGVSSRSLIRSLSLILYILQPLQIEGEEMLVDDVWKLRRGLHHVQTLLRQTDNLVDRANRIETIQKAYVAVGTQLVRSADGDIIPTGRIEVDAQHLIELSGLQTLHDTAARPFHEASHAHLFGPVHTASVLEAWEPLAGVNILGL